MKYLTSISFSQFFEDPKIDTSEPYFSYHTSINEVNDTYFHLQIPNQQQITLIF